jgi:DNA repair exonuclease SbcCD ATPase subunit
MPERDEILEKLDQLENKMKTSLLEVEKRLVNLESAAPTDISELKERMKELEDLQMLLELENVKLKEKLGAGELEFGIPETLDSRLKTIEQRIAELSKVSAVEVKGIPKGLQERITTLERTIAGLKSIKEGKIPASLLQDVEELKKSLKTQAIPADIVKKMEDQNKRLKVMETSLEEMEKRMRKEFSRMEDVIENTGRVLTEKGMSQFLDRIIKLKDELRGEKRELEREKEEIVRLLEDRRDIIEKMGRTETNVQKADALLTKMMTLEERIKMDIDKIEGLKNNVETKLDSAVDRVNTIKKNIDSLVESRIEEGVGKMRALRSTLESRLDMLDEKIRSEIEKSESLRENLEQKTRIFIENSKKVERLYNQMKLKTERAIQDVKSDFEDNFETINKSRAEIIKTVAELKDGIEDIRKLKSKIGPIIESDIDGRLKRLEDGIKALEEGGSVVSTIENHDKEIAALKNELSSRVIEIDSVQKHVADLNVKISGFMDSLRSLKDFEERIVRRLRNVPSTNELEKTREDINALKKELDTRKIEFENISKRLDKVPSRNELNRLKEGIDQTKDMKEKVDLLVKRLEDLPSKKEIDEIKDKLGSVDTKEFREMNNRMQEIFKQLENKASRKEINEIRSSLHEVKPVIKEVKDMKTELQKEIDGLKKQVSRPVNVENLVKEMEKQKNMIKGLEDKIAAETSRFLAENLEQFAITLDKRLPDFVTKNEFRESMERLNKKYENSMKEMNNRIKTITAPDITPLMSRMNNLEKNIKQILENLKKPRVPTPVVVE